MSFELCEKVRELVPYEPISGTYKIRLDANESYFNLSPELKEEIKNVIDGISFNRYPDPAAKELTEAFADYYGLESRYITVTNGSDEMLYLLASAILQKGSRVVVTEPDFSMYGFYSFLSENEILTYKKDAESLDIDIDSLIAFVKDNEADMLIFSNPCNPTGQGVDAEKARRLVQECSDTLVVLDEAYMDFWDESVLAYAHEYPNLIVLKTASKAVGAAGIRLGFAVSNDTITCALRAAKSPYNVNALSQEIGRCIYRHGELLKKCRDEIVKNTAELYIALKKLADNYKLPFVVYETHANFVFVKTEKAREIYEYLLENSIAVRFFGNAQALRITVGSAEENRELLVALEKYVMKEMLSYS